MMGLKMLGKRSFSQFIQSEFTEPLGKGLSIETFLSQITNKNDAKRKHILGTEFCRFAITAHLYTNKSEIINQQDLKSLNAERNQKLRQLALYTSKNKLKNGEQNEMNSNEGFRFKIATIGDEPFVSAEVCSALTKWKFNAYDQIKNSVSGHDGNVLNDDKIHTTIISFNYTLIGWFLQTYGMRAALLLLQWLGVIVQNSDCTNTDTFEEFWLQPKSPLLNSADADNAQKLNKLLHGYDRLERDILKYSFRDKSFLLQAVTSKSFTANTVTSTYRGLDFLGDAVLNYVIVRHLIEDAQHFTAHEISNILMYLLNNTAVASIAVRNHIHEYLRFTSPKVRNSMDTYVALQRGNNYQPMLDLYYVNDKSYVITAPSLLRDGLESIAGAIFLDSGLSVDTVASVFVPLLQTDIEKIYEFKPSSPIVELKLLQPTAKFSKPKKLPNRQISITVTLPELQNAEFIGISQNPNSSAWAAAKNAIMGLRKK